MKEITVAYRAELPCTVPPGGLAVVLAGGRVVPDGVQGPGALRPAAWREHGRHLEAVLFPATTLRLRLDVDGLHSAEGISLDLTVDLALHIEHPARFLTDVVRDAVEFTEGDLAALLRDPVRAALVQDLRRCTLADLESDRKLRGRMGAAIEHYLTTEADLLGRSGLAIAGVDAFDLRCRVWDEVRQVQEAYYLRAGLARAEAEGRKLLDEALLQALRAHLPVKDELVAVKEQMADRLEQEEADARLAAGQRRRRVRYEDLAAAQASRPSALRPELWRVDLGDKAHTAPLYHEGRVYAITAGGRLSALYAESGEPAWPRPVELGTATGDGLAWAGDRLWVPGHDGTLYGLDPGSGAIVHCLHVGGRLSSPPLVAEGLLYVSVDVDAATLRPGAGHVVAADPARGQEVGRWQVSSKGLRAQPAVWGRTLYAGDRAGGFYALDLRRGRVEALPLHGGRILGAPLVDEAGGQVIVGDSYGFLLALNRAGRQCWSARLGGALVGQPLLHGGALYVGTGDGRLYSLDPATGQELRPPFQTRGAIATPPVGWRDLVFAGSNDGYLYALEAATGRLFWQYHSGSPVCVPPAVTPDGRLYVLDRDGRLNALRWCLHRYSEGARRAQEADPPRWEEAVDLWLFTDETEAALEAAKIAGRLDLEAELAARLQRYGYAAGRYEALAQRSRNPLTAAAWWAEAADLWQLDQQMERAERCRLQDAENRSAPLLRLEAANLPQLTLGQPEVVQVCLTNWTGFWAQDVQLTYEGHVQKAGKISLGAVEPHGRKPAEVEVVPTQLGSATLRVAVHYADPRGNRQRPVALEVRLRVQQPPVVHHHYHGPHVGGDGVIIVRGEGTGGERQLRVQSGEDAIEVGGTGCRACPACGEVLEAGYRFCSRCGKEV